MTTIYNQQFRTYRILDPSAANSMASAQTKTQLLTDQLDSSQESMAKNAKRALVSDSIAAGVVFALVMTVGQRIVGFGRGILFCRLMTDQQLGQWSMVWSYLMLLAPLAVFGLPGCFGKFTEYYRKRGQFAVFVQRISMISIVSTTILASALLIFSEQFSYLFFRDRSQVGLVKFLGVALVFVSTSNFLTSLMESLRQVRAVTLMRFITGMVFAVVGTAMIALWQDAASAATTGYAISCLIGIIPAVWILRKYRSGIANDTAALSHGAMWKRLAPFALWLWVADIFHNLFEISDRCMLIHLSSSTAEQAQGAVGQYHSGRVVPLLMVSVAAMLAGILLPYLSEAWEANKKEKAQQLLSWGIKLSALGFTFGGVLILLLSPILFEVIFQGRYDEGLAVLPVTLVYCIWFGLYSICQIYLWVAEKGKLVVFATVVGLSVNVGLNFMLIPSIGLQGAVLATAVGNATVLGLMLFINQKMGCKADIGVWLSALIPLTLLFGTIPALLSAMAIAALCFTSNLFLTKTEKSFVVEMVQKKFGRFLSR